MVKSGSAMEYLLYRLASAGNELQMQVTGSLLWQCLGYESRQGLGPAAHVPRVEWAAL